MIENFAAAERKMRAADHHQFFGQFIANGDARPRKFAIGIEKFRANNVFIRVGEHQQIRIIAVTDNESAPVFNARCKDFGRGKAFIKRQNESEEFLRADARRSETQKRRIDFFALNL